MSAGVRVEGFAFVDSRFRHLAALMGVTHFDAFARVIYLWRECTQRQKYSLPESLVATLVPPKLLIAAELGESVLDNAGASTGTVRLRGTEGRIEWYGEATDKDRKAKGGSARAASATRGNDGRFVSGSHELLENAGPCAGPCAGEKLDQQTSSTASYSSPSPSLIKRERRTSPVRASKTKKKSALLEKWRGESEALWALQERLRRSKTPLVGRDDRLERIAARLEEGHSVADCESVLRAYAAEAQKKPESAKWFNGETNWRRDNFDRTLGGITTRPGNGQLEERVIDGVTYRADPDGKLWRMS